jgi:hypothetical protein
MCVIFRSVEVLFTEEPVRTRILRDKTDVSVILKKNLFVSICFTQILSLYATDDYVIDSFTRSYC